MKKSLCIIMISISICFINCGDGNSPSGLELVTDVNMNNGTTTVVVNNVDELILGIWACTEFNLNDGTGWIDIDEIGSSFEIYFQADGLVEVYYFGEYLTTDWSSSGNTVTLTILGGPTTITNVTGSTFYLVIDDGMDRVDFRFER